MRVSLLVLIAVASLSCVGSDGDGNGALTSSDAGARSPSGSGAASTSATGADTDLCRAHLAWDMACSAMDPQPRGDPYWGESECLQGPWEKVKPEYLRAAVACFETLPCERSDDACTAAGLAALGVEDESDLAGDALYQRCVEFALGCDGVVDDVCLFFPVFTDEAVAEAARCLDGACEGAPECLMAAGVR